MAVCKQLVIAVVLLLSTSVTSSSAAETFVIFSANPAMPELSEAKAKMIYMGKSKSIQRVGRVKLLDWPLNSSQRTQFYQTLINKSPAQVNSQWTSLAFSGKAKPPEELSSMSIDSIMAWLSANPTGLAYAPASMVPENAIVVLEVK